MLDGEVVLPVVGEALVELGLLFLGDVRGLALPDGLVLVDLLLLVVYLLDLLFLLLVLLLALLLDLALFLGLLLLVLHVVIVGDLLLLGLLAEELDGELDELGVLADDVLQLLLVQLLQLVVLHVQDHAGAATEPLRLLRGGGAHSELLACTAFPHVGVELVLLGDDGHLIGHEEA